MIILGTNSIKETGFNIANSCRFDGSSSSLTKAQGASPSSNLKATFSMWLKKSDPDADQHFLNVIVSNDNRTFINFTSDSELQVAQKDGGSTSFHLSTNRKFRDVSAWYHIVITFDTANGTASNRIKIYVNGVQETSFSTETYPSQNRVVNLLDETPISIGAYNNASHYFDGYMAQVIHVNNQALDATSFGEFDSDSGIWKPIDITALTVGTNGYFLDFEDASNLGNDASGGTDFTENNLAATDQSTDTCTNNFCTLNPLDNYYPNAAFSEGNLKIVTGSGREASSSSTFYLTKGKWFWETKFLSASAPFVGIQPVVSSSNTATAAVLQTNGLGILKTGKVETTDGSGGSTVLATYSTFTTNDIIGVALDLDGNKIYFYKNGSILGASGVSITDPASTTNGHYMIAVGTIAGQDTISMNFGSPAYSESGGNSDGNGYGNYAGSVPSGYYSLNTKNLAEYG